MNKEELREEIAFEKNTLCKLVHMAKLMGNKDWKNTPVIKNS